MIKKPHIDYKNQPTTPIGNKEVNVYKWKYNNDGTKELVVEKTKNIYNEIQEYKNDVDLVTIINRLGGVEQLEAIPARGIYADMTQLPKNLHEAVELQEKAKKSFNQLPTKIREAFNNDPLQFMAQIDTDNFKKAFENYYKEKFEGGMTNEQKHRNTIQPNANEDNTTK